MFEAMFPLSKLSSDAGVGQSSNARSVPGAEVEFDLAALFLS